MSPVTEELSVEQHPIERAIPGDDPDPPYDSGPGAEKTYWLNPDEFHADVFTALEGIRSDVRAVDIDAFLQVLRDYVLAVERHSQSAADWAARLTVGSSDQNLAAGAAA